jgi:hypothetical protein
MPAWDANGSPPELRVLYATEFYVLSEAKMEKVAVLRRTAQGFTSLDVVRSENERLIGWFSKCLAPSIIVDMREAPPNNDEHFEVAMRRLRSAVGRRFERVVVLVASATGQMQVTRLHRHEGASYSVTRDHAQAWRLARAESC